MWSRFYEALETAGIDVYSPGQKQGVCTAPYVVVWDGKQEGRAGGQGSVEVMNVMACVPSEAYSQLGPLVQSVKQALCGFRCSGKQGAVAIDDAAQAYTLTLEYQVFRKNILR